MKAFSGDAGSMNAHTWGTESLAGMTSIFQALFRPLAGYAVDGVVEL